jgi:hypothetical protein
MTMQSMGRFCNYKKVWYKNQIKRSYGSKLQMFEGLETKL